MSSAGPFPWLTSAPQVKHLAALSVQAPEAPSPAFASSSERHCRNSSAPLLFTRFAQEYKKDPDRGYGAGVITVFKKLLNPKCRDVYEPARAQFNGKGSYGNGGAMRVAGIPLAYSSVQDVQKVLGRLVTEVPPPQTLSVET